MPVRTSLGDESLLADDELEMRAPATASARARLLPSGDAYFLLHGAERELLVPREAVEAEASALPLTGVERPTEVVWDA